MKVVRRRHKKRRLKASDRREAVLDAAMAITTRTGVFRVTMADVADEGGVTKPVVYDYFANADELLAALVKREGARALEVIAEVLPEPSSLPARGDRAAFLFDRLGAFLESVRDKPEVWRVTLLPPEGTSPTVRARVEKEREVVRLRIVELLKWAIPDTKGLDLDLMAHAIHALTQRFARQMILEPDHYPPERILSFVAGSLKAVRR